VEVVEIERESKGFVAALAVVAAFAPEELADVAVVAAAFAPEELADVAVVAAAVVAAFAPEELADVAVVAVAVVAAFAPEEFAGVTLDAAFFATAAGVELTLAAVEATVLAAPSAPWAGVDALAIDATGAFGIVQEDSWVTLL